MSSDAEASSSKQLLTKIETEVKSPRKLPNEVDAEASSSKQLPTKVEAEAKCPKGLPDVVDVEVSSSKQLPTKVEAEADSPKKLPDEVNVEAKNSKQLPDKIETKADSPTQLPNMTDTEAGSSNQLPYKVSLRSMDGEEFTVDAVVAMQSGTIKHMIEDELHGNCIPLPNVSGTVLGMILEFFKHHRHDDKIEAKESTFFCQFEPDPLEEELKNFDREFVKNLDRDSLLDLAVAADYLDAKKLLDVTCQAVADMIKDMSVEDVRDFFNIENDYTPEEEEQLRNENKWAFE